MTRLGVDTGGTFTDFVLLHDGRLVTHKVRSTPDDPARAVLAGLEHLRAVADPPEVVHGSTVATNAVLERRGARVALVATRGFTDVLAIGRQTRPALYDFQVEARPPLVPPDLTFAIGERLDATGQVLVPLDPAQVAALVEAMGAARPEAIAVCLLHSYANAAHEHALAAALQGLGVPVCASADVLPEYREFERWSTTALNAYVAPLMSRYLGRLADAIAPRRLRVMQSNGGALSAAQAGATPAHTVLSGPAGGAVGAQALGRASGHPRVIGFDMGGTSTDVTLIDEALALTAESAIDGLPVRLPMIDIHTVGAGGGSVAWIDSGGSLRVGPRSAGADPGPVCYGQGEAVTVTDANLLLGRLDPRGLLGGRLPLDVERTRQVASRFASSLGLDPTTLAGGIVRIANATMERAIRVVTVQRGIDPRGFALLAFGGAGGMHACAMAEALDMRTVLVPRWAGVLSALGMLVADTVRDYTRTMLVDAACRHDDLARLFEPLVARARADLAAEGVGDDRLRIERSADVRYAGQSYELTVPFTASLRAAFDALHLQRYGYADASRAAEIVNVRVRAVGISPPFAWPRIGRARGEPRALACRPVWFDGDWLQTQVFDLMDLLAGHLVTGPAIVGGPEATVVVAPRWSCHVDDIGTLVLTRVR